MNCGLSQCRTIFAHQQQLTFRASEIEPASSMRPMFAAPRSLAHFSIYHRAVPWSWWPILSLNRCHFSCRRCGVQWTRYSHSLSRTSNWLSDGICYNSVARRRCYGSIGMQSWTTFSRLKSKFCVDSDRSDAKQTHVNTRFHKAFFFLSI